MSIILRVVQLSVIDTTRNPAILHIIVREVRLCLKAAHTAILEGS